MARRKRKRPNGMGGVYKRGAVWCIRWRQGTRRFFQSGFPNEDLARKVLATKIADQIAGREGLAVDPKSVPTIDELAKDWLERREATHRSHKKDSERWKNHLKPFFGHLRPSEVDVALIRRFVEHERGSNKRTRGGKCMDGEKLSPSTVQRSVRLLSSLFSDIVERRLIRVDPTKRLPRTLRKLYKPTFNTKKTPFLERLDDVKRVYLALPEPIGVAFALGAWAGLRTGEVLGLAWEQIDLAHRRMHICQQVQESKLVESLKDGEPRMVPILPSLEWVLKQYKLRTGGQGLLFKPSSPKGKGRGAKYMKPHTLHAALDAALVACDLRRITWYQATRHTFASQWVLSGRSIEKLAIILGHSVAWVTERYAHMRPDLFSAEDLAALDVDLTAPAGEVVDLRAKMQAAKERAAEKKRGVRGHSVGTDAASVEKETATSI